MKTRHFTAIYNLLCLAALLVLAAAVGPCLAEGEGIPFPYILKAKLSVNGVLLTSSYNADYTIKVTDTSEVEFAPVDSDGQTFGRTSTDTVTGRFQYNIPIYDATTQSGGAEVGETACISVSYKGTQLFLTSPAQGSLCPPGTGQLTVGSAGGSTSLITITAVTPASSPTVSVQCGGIAKNSTTPVSFGSVALGASKSDTTCVIRNSAKSTTNLEITDLTVSGCGFSITSPSPLPDDEHPIALSYNRSQPLTLKYAPCGVGGIQTGTLTIESNDAAHTSYPVALTGTGVPTIQLSKYWNLIGLPVNPTNTALTKVLSSILSNVAVVWTFIDGEWDYYDPNDTGGSLLKTMTPWNAYWIYMKSAATLTVK